MEKEKLQVIIKKISDCLIRHKFADEKHFDFEERHKNFELEDFILYRLQWWSTFRGGIGRCPHTGAKVNGFYIESAISVKEDLDRVRACNEELLEIFREYLLLILQESSRLQSIVSASITDKID
jgi:CRISPR/Cas system CMR-associated protein Cmr1 (group 7 of RAMP superfamily)